MVTLKISKEAVNLDSRSDIPRNVCTFHLSWDTVIQTSITDSFGEGQGKPLLYTCTPSRGFWTRNLSKVGKASKEGMVMFY